MLAGLYTDEHAYLDIAVGEAITAVLLAHSTSDPYFQLKVYVAAKRKMIDEHRRRRRLLPIDRVESSDGQARLRSAGDEGVLLDRISAAQLVDALPPKQAEAMRLHFLEEFTIEEIAERLNISPNSVKDRLKNAMRALRAMVE